jgi:hypothetical protein
MSQAENENDGKSAQDQANSASEAAASAKSATTIGEKKKEGLAFLLEWSKPYRDVIAIFVAVVVALSGAIAWGVAWVTANVATQSQLHYLECRVTNNIMTQLLPVHLEEYAGKIDWRSSQIKLLAQNSRVAPQTVKAIVILTEEMNSLTKDQRDAAVKLQKDIDAIVKSCISEKPQPEKAT